MKSEQFKKTNKNQPPSLNQNSIESRFHNRPTVLHSVSEGFLAKCAFDVAFLPLSRGTCYIPHAMRELPWGCPSAPGHQGEPAQAKATWPSPVGQLPWPAQDVPCCVIALVFGPPHEKGPHVQFWGFLCSFSKCSSKLMGFAASIPSPASWSVFIHFQKVPLGGYRTACQPSLGTPHDLFSGGGCVSDLVRGAGPGAAHPGHVGNSCSMCSDSTGFLGLRPLYRPCGTPAEPAPQCWSSLSCWLLGFRPLGGERRPRDGLSAQVTLSGVVSVVSALPWVRAPPFAGTCMW